MSTKTIVAWVNGDAQDIEVNIPEYMELEPTIEDRLYALENKTGKFISSIDLVAANWVGEGPYTQVVQIPDVTANSKIDLQPSTEQLCIFYEKDLAFVAENDDGVVTVSCIGQKPTHDHTIQITVTEVAVNG